MYTTLLTVLIISVSGGNEADRLRMCGGDIEIQQPPPVEARLHRPPCEKKAAGDADFKLAQCIGGVGPATRREGGPLAGGRRRQSCRQPICSMNHN